MRGIAAGDALDRPSVWSGCAGPGTLAVAFRALIFALLAGTIALVTMRHGIVHTPDSWAYWEGSVSILSGDGYKYFGAVHINDFPPLFAVLLSAAQAVFGVSGATLIGTVSFLAAAAAFAWCYMIFYFTHGTFRANPAGYLAAASVSLVLGARFHVLWSETLLLALLGVLVFVLVRPPDSRKSHRGILRLLTISFVLTLMLLTRNAAVVFWPPVALIVMLEVFRSGSSMRRKLVESAILVAPPLVWYLVGVFVGLRGTQRLTSGGEYSPVEYLRQLFSGLAEEFAPRTRGIGFVVLALVTVCLLLGFWNSVHSRPVAWRMGYVPIVGVVSIVGLFVLFNVTLIFDPLKTRFLWHVPLLAITLLAMLAAAQRRRYWARYVLLGALLMLFVCTGERAYSVVRASAPGWGDRGVTADETIRTDYYGGGPDVIQGDHMLISPPEFEWLHRSPLP
jgi:hypothetical protein